MIHADRFFDSLIDRLKVWGLYVILVLVPITYAPGEIRPFQEKCMMIALMSYASFYFGNIWMTLFFSLNMALFAWNGLEIGSGQVFNIFLGCLMFTISRTFFLTNKVSIIFTAIKTLLPLTLVWGIFQVCSIDPIMLGQSGSGQIHWGHSFNSFCGAFHMPAAHGMFLALCIPFFFSLGWIIPIALSIPIFLCHSASVYLTASIMFIYGIFYIRMVTFKRKFVYYVFIALLAVLGVGGVWYDYSNDKLTGKSRFENWHTYIKYACARPIFGWGPDSFRNTTPNKNFIFISDEDYNPMVLIDEGDRQIAKYMSADEGKRLSRFNNRIPKSIAYWREAHNEFIQIFFEYGIVGIFLIGFFLHEIYIRFRLSCEDKDVRILFGAILCYLIFSSTQFPFHLARLALFLPVILGAFFAKTDKDWDTFVKGRQYVGA